MAVTTPIGLSPEASATGVSIVNRWEFTWTPFAATAGTLVEVRVRVSTNSGMTALVYDSGLVAVDDHRQGDGWHDRFPEDWPLGPCPASTALWWDVTVRSSVPETATSVAIAFTTGAARLTDTQWSAGQP